MKPSLLAIAAVALVGAAAGGGYWLGRHDGPSAPRLQAAGSSPPPAVAAPQSERAVLYYQDPDGNPDYSPTPKKTSDGRDYVPVFDEPAQAAASPAPPSGPRKILYYRNPMGLPDTSPAPKKDSMGMDYVPVYQGDEADDAGVVKISPAKIQRLGVRTEPAVLRELVRAVRTVGTVQPDERRLYVVNTKFDGWIEKLRVNATGQAVKRGDPLMDVYAPELVVAQQEYLLAWRSLQDMAGAGDEIRVSAKQLANAALQRLRNWDISDDQIKRLQREGAFTRTLTLRAPANGIVMEKPAVEGMKFAAGDTLYRIADLSTVWVLADVFEQDLAAVRDGAAATVAVAAYPVEAFAGKVAFVYPTVTRETRTAKVRIELPNPDGRLRTDMYATVEIASPAAAGPVVAVPNGAVLNSGSRQAVLVDRGEGRFEPREVKLGAEAAGFTEIRSGLEPGEKVVVGANFLIDAESNLKAALRGFTPADATAAPGGGAR